MGADIQVNSMTKVLMLKVLWCQSSLFLSSLLYEDV